MKKDILKKFRELLEEGTEIPQDELRDHYLVPLNKLVSDNPDIVNYVFEEQTALMWVIKKIIKNDNHPIRLNSLEMLTWNMIDNMSATALNQQDKEGNSVVHLACMMESFSVGILDLMKNQGADFSLINKKGEIPFMLVADSNSLDDLKFIHVYTNKTLLNLKDINGMTALMRAIKAKKINNIYYLLESNVDIFVQDNSGMSVVDWLNSKEQYNKKSHPKFWAEVESLISLFIKKRFHQK